MMTAVSGFFGLITDGFQLLDIIGCLFIFAGNGCRSGVLVNG
jgi:hypothetical protein